MEVGVVDPLEAAVVALRRAHHEFALAVTPAGHVHAFDPAQPPPSGTTFFGARDAEGTLVGIAALRPVGGRAVDVGRAMGSGGPVDGGRPVDVGRPVGSGSIVDVGDAVVELKSMHTAAAARGRGVAAALLGHLMEAARADGFSDVSLETGTDAAFAPARELYRRFGFVECPPFAEYSANPFSVCMTRPLADLPG